jgi:hypothetical protein
MVAEFSAQAFGRIDRRDLVKMAEEFNAQAFDLTDVQTFDRIDFAPIGLTSATSTLTTTITSSTDARRGTISPETISTASGIVGRTR